MSSLSIFKGSSIEHNGDDYRSVFEDPTYSRMSSTHGTLAEALRHCHLVGFVPFVKSEPVSNAIHSHEGGTGITNFSQHDLPVYMEAIRRFNLASRDLEDTLYIGQPIPVEGYTSDHTTLYALRVSGNPCFSTFWIMFDEVRATDVGQKAKQLSHQASWIALAAELEAKRIIIAALLPYVRQNDKQLSIPMLVETIGKRVKAAYT